LPPDPLYQAPFPHFAFSLFSSAYELPNLQLLCFDNDATVPGVGGDRIHVT